MDHLAVKGEDDDQHSNLTTRSERSERSDYGDDMPDYHPEDEYYRQQQMYQQSRRPTTHVTNSFEYQPPAPFVHNRKNMGIKNLSSQVGAAINGIATPRIEFDQASNDGFDKIRHPMTYPRKSLAVSEDDTHSISSRVAHTHTDQGYFDLKFYHNRLW